MDGVKCKAGGPAHDLRSYFVPKENLTDLAVLMIHTENPPLHMSCDWIRNPLALGLMLIRELKVRGETKWQVRLL